MYQFDNNRGFRPLMLLAYVDSAHAAHCGRHFRRLGWEVHQVASAGEVYRFLKNFTPQAIVLDIELPDESGWLTCAKVTKEDPSRQVVMLAPSYRPEDAQQLGQVHAQGLVTRQDSMETFAEAILGKRYAEAV